MPFTVEELMAVFVRYNTAIWPLQVVAHLAAVAVLAAVLRPGRGATIAVTTLLALMWAVNGIGYHWQFFAAINPIARLFAAVFVAQAVMLALAPRLFPDLRFVLARDVRTALGLGLMGFAAVVYPLWGIAAGHVYPAAPVFGVAPCPTTIFTAGVLLLGAWPAVRWLAVIPGLWAMVGSFAALSLGVPQDYALVVTAAILAATALLSRAKAGT